jgi:hypothetical protein
MRLRGDGGDEAKGAQAAVGAADDVDTGDALPEGGDGFGRC